MPAIFLFNAANVYYCDMNLVQELKKQSIDLTIDGHTFIFALPDKTEKRVSQRDLEHYLLICLTNYVKI